MKQREKIQRLMTSALSGIISGLLWDFCLFLANGTKAVFGVSFVITGFLAIIIGPKILEIILYCLEFIFTSSYHNKLYLINSDDLNVFDSETSTFLAYFMTFSFFIVLTIPILALVTIFSIFHMIFHKKIQYEKKRIV